jgi:hypothetical protein
MGPSIDCFVRDYALATLKAIFLVSVRSFTETGTLESDGRILAAGYSPIAILGVLVMIVVMLLFIVGVGFTKLKAGVPIVGANSALIAAACHPDAEEPSDVAFRKLSLRIVGSSSEGGSCTFSTKALVSNQSDSSSADLLALDSLGSSYTVHCYDEIE